MVNKIFLGLLLFVPLSIIAKALHATPILIFTISAIAIIPLAKYIGEATEELAAYSGPAVGGLLNATFGNATELIIGMLALQAGLIEVVKASLTGSIIANLLLVLGLAIFFGGYKNEDQTFSSIGAKAGASTLLLASVSLVIPAMFVITSPGVSSERVWHLSIIVAILMIIAYIGSLVFTLKTHRHLYMKDIAEVEDGRWTKKKSFLVLFTSTIIVAYISEILVSTIRPLVLTFGWTELFIGVVFIAIIGNVTEHISAITAAVKNKLDLSIQIAIGSSTQIVMFVAPVLVITSLFLSHPMNLIFQTFELVAIIFSVFIANSVIEDGKSHWYEGLQLLVTYAIIAVAFYIHP